MRFEGGAERITSAADHLDDFERDTACVLDMIEGVMPEAAWLSDGETLTYLHSTISTHNKRIALPATPMHLDALPADELLVGGHTALRRTSTLTYPIITDFPAWTLPGRSNELTRLAFHTS